MFCLILNVYYLFLVEEIFVLLYVVVGYSCVLFVCVEVWFGVCFRVLYVGVRGFGFRRSVGMLYVVVKVVSFEK